MHSRLKYVITIFRDFNIYLDLAQCMLEVWPLKLIILSVGIVFVLSRL